MPEIIAQVWGLAPLPSHLPRCSRRGRTRTSEMSMPESRYFAVMFAAAREARVGNGTQHTRIGLESAQAMRSVLSCRFGCPETSLPPSLPPSLLSPWKNSDEHLNGHAHEQATPRWRDACGRCFREPARFRTHRLAWRRRGGGGGEGGVGEVVVAMNQEEEERLIYLAPSLLQSCSRQTLPIHRGRGQPRLRG